VFDAETTGFLSVNDAGGAALWLQPGDLSGHEAFARSGRRDEWISHSEALPGRLARPIIRDATGGI